MVETVFVINFQTQTSKQHQGWIEKVQ